MSGNDMNVFGTATEGKTIEKKTVAETFLAGHGSPLVAQVSLANTKVSGAPSTPGILPIDNGLKPCGSRAAKMRLRVIITIENAPSTWLRDSAMQSTSVEAFECAIN